MKKRWQLSGFGVVLIVILAAGAVIGGFAALIRGSGPDDQLDIYLHFYRSQAGVWATEPYRIRTVDMSRGDLVDTLLERLLLLPEQLNGIITLPRGIYERNIINGRTVLIMMKAEYEELSHFKRNVALASIVHTLTELYFVDNVQFFAGGQEVSDNGRPLGLLGRDNLLITSEALPENITTRIYTLYFANADLTELAAMEREITIQPSRPLETLLIKELIAGVEASEYRRLIPADIRLRSNTILDGGICYIDFNFDFLARMDNEELKLLTVNSIVNTITANSSADFVQLLFGGDKTSAIIETVDMRLPLARVE